MHGTPTLLKDAGEVKRASVHRLRHVVEGDPAAEGVARNVFAAFGAVRMLPVGRGAARLPVTPPAGRRLRGCPRSIEAR